MQVCLTETETYAMKHRRKINETKTKAMLFNSTKKFDFMPQLRFTNGHTLEVVEEYRLLGVTVSSNLNWQSHVGATCRKAYQRMWILRRLKSL